MENGICWPSNNCWGVLTHPQNILDVHGSKHVSGYKGPTNPTCLWQCVVCWCFALWRFQPLRNNIICAFILQLYGVFYVFLNWGISKSPWVSISTCLQNWMTCGNPATETSGPVDLQERWAQGAAGKVWTWAGGLLNHYPLVNSHITNWKITMFFWWVNPLKMAIFNSKLLVYQRVFQIFETVGCLYSSDLWWMWSLVSLHIVCGPKPRYPDGYLYVFIQWEFQDPKMEVLYHIRPYFGGISPYIGLIYGRYLQFRILEWPLIYTHLKIHKIPWFISIPCRFLGDTKSRPLTASATWKGSHREGSPSEGRRDMPDIWDIIQPIKHIPSGNS